ncbi:unnamed protein product [Euphydryas editha]|uniref:Integrase catalytic domain-containing protein n=1 Tax=Euphydryas editha TaxID=104508 RepID=A0AAU9TET2_EUPED|nr:unnamed protein product [Euphydryas editha]
MLSSTCNLVLRAGLQPIQKGTAANIRNFLAQIQQQIYALKNLEQPVHNWDMLLLSILSKKLDTYTNRAYHLDKENPQELPTLNEFISFLEKRAMALEDSPAERLSNCFDKSKNSKVNNSIVTKIENECKFCKKNGHQIHMCPSFQTAIVQDRLKFVKTNFLCNICLKSHTGKCKFNFKCKICKLNHNSLLHEEPNTLKDIPVNLHVRNTTNTILLPTACINLLDNCGNSHRVKALLDSGSQVSLINISLVKRLNLKPKEEKTSVISMGGHKNIMNKSVELIICPDIQNIKLRVNSYVVDSITAPLPQQYIEISKINLPNNIKLADPTFYETGEILVLLGADIYFNILLDGHIKLDRGPVLQNTLFGYVVGGSVMCQKICNTGLIMVSNVLSCQHNADNLNTIMEQFWLSEKIPENININKQQLNKAEENFQKSFKLINNIFEVDLPLKAPLNELQLGNSFSAALQRFLSLEKKFKTQPQYFEQYKKFINEYLDLGHAKIVDISNYDVNNGPVYFLSHHAVMNEASKTTKLRVVFNGSMKTKNNTSLNDVMMNGPVVQKELFEILILFRTYKLTIICDIEKMFRNILINKDQRSLQNILWREDSRSPISCLQLQTVTYGLKASTYLATRCLKELASKYKNDFPQAAQALLYNTYVDDVLAGADNLSQLKELKGQLIGLLKLGNFKLHKWCSNTNEVLNDIPEEHKYFDEIGLNKNDNTIKTLGIKYNINTDSFTFSYPVNDTILNTKRNILAFIGKIYDPLGLIGPLVVIAKLYMQELWALKVEWDTILTDQQSSTWKKFMKNLKLMDKLIIKRCLYDNTQTNRVELIGYSDASFKAFGCCLYLKMVKKDGTVNVNLLCSKSRVAPLNKTLTIPQLELNGALLMAQLVCRVSEVLKSRFAHDVFLYTDSQIVLAWIVSGTTIKCNLYVNNRVKQINNLTKNFNWGYIQSSNNPADLLSRGNDPHKMQSQSLWWHGPAELKDKTFVHQTAVCSETPISNDLEVKVCNVQQEYSLMERFSDINKLQRVLAYMLRFYENCKNKQIKLQGNLTPQELQNSLKLIIKLTQKQYFSNEIDALLQEKPIKSNLCSLNPFLDKNRILRVGGRLQNSNKITYDKMHPIILPKSSYITHLIIQKEHLRLLHAGPKQLLSSLSQKYWLMNGIREIKKVTHKCITCFKLKAVAAKQLMGSLPIQRITNSRPFEVTGVDFCGPFSTKIARIRNPIISKSYIAIFVCFSTKAIHAELVSDLSTEAFLASLKRFIARRGIPREIFCDNAKTFKGAQNKLNDLFKLNINAVNNFCTNSYIKFRFIPSYSPEFGGLWEASVKSLKYHLKRIVGNVILTYEELNTVITQIEAVLNSRPLLPMSSDISNFEYLTPGHFLIGTALTSFPELDLSERPLNRLRFWDILTKLRQDFWKVWSRDYLTQLQNRPKWKHPYRNLKEGDLVIVRANSSPLVWPMARVVKTYEGPDKKVRVVDIKMANSDQIFRRSYTKLCPLPITD